MKHLPLLLLFVWASFSAPAQEQFDSTFATDGLFILDASTGFDDYFFDMIVLPDGKIVAVGYAITESGQSDMLVVRLEADGALDAGFGEDGILLIDINTWDQAFSVVSYEDGKIVIGGRSGPTSSATQAAVLMLHADGSLDEAFGSGGIFLASLGIGSSSVNVLLIDGENQLLAGGNSNFDIHVLKLTPEGTLVPDYGINGMATTAYVFPLACDDMALQPDGKLLIGGKVNPFTDDIVVIRLNEDGSNDETFGDASFFIYDFDLSIYGSDESAESMVVEENGRILIGGHTRYYDESDSHFYVMALDSEGNLDPTFGADGIQRYPTIGFSFGNDLLVTPDQAILLAGGFSGIGSDNGDVSILKLDATGGIDTTYGNNGLQLFGITEGSIDRVFSMQPQFDDKWVVAGFYRPSGGNFASFVARLGDAEDPILATSSAEAAVFKVFPNPVSDELYFELPPHWASIDRVEVYDLSGNLVLATTDLPGASLDVGALSSGFYVVRVFGGREVLRQAFVKG